MRPAAGFSQPTFMRICSMSKSHRQKGLRNENRIKDMHKDLGIYAERVSAPYKAGPDLNIEVGGHSFKGEVKARRHASGWKTLKTWFNDADALFLIEDREQPLVCLRWETYRRLISLKEARDGPTNESEAAALR